jgi:hypothetical protein
MLNCYLVEFKSDSTDGTVRKYTVLEKDLVKVAEEVTIEHKHTPKEKQGFSSQQEIWEYLLAGNQIVKHKSIFALKDGSLHKKTARGVWVAWSSSLRDVSAYTKYTEPKWYDTIPEQGILCWVTDSSTGAIIEPDLIKQYGSESIGSFKSDVNNWKYATPVTQEEVNKLIYKPETS